MRRRFLVFQEIRMILLGGTVGDGFFLKEQFI